MQITGGKISFKRSFQPEQYGSKGAEVEISFLLAEGEEIGNKLDAVGVMVKGKALELCNLKTEAKANVPADVETAKTSVPVTGQKETAAAALNAKDTTETVAKAGKGNQGGKKEPLGKVDASGIPEGLKRTAENKVKEVEAEGEDLGEAFDEDAAESQPEVTDLMLASAATRKVAALKEKHAGKAPVLVKELITKFVAPPKKMADIPQNLRQEFLKKLEELT